MKLLLIVMGVWVVLSLYFIVTVRGEQRRPEDSTRGHGSGAWRRATLLIRGDVRGREPWGG